MNMISVLDISLVKCYGTVKTKEESFLFQKPIASSKIDILFNSCKTIISSTIFSSLSQHNGNIQSAGVYLW